LRVKGQGLRVEGLGFRVWGLEFRVKGFGFRVQGAGMLRQTAPWAHARYVNRPYRANRPVGNPGADWWFV